MQKHVIPIAMSITLILIGIVVVVYIDAAAKTGAIVIPAGNTYLGPTPSSPNAPAQFTTASDTPWHEVRGTLFPYAFEIPQTLTLTQPSGNNPYDLYEIVWGGNDPASMVLIGVDNHIDPNVSKETYVRTWWKQFSGLTGVKSVTAFTNKKGLTGYRAYYINGAGESSNTDVFFSVPGHPTTIIHLANGVLEQSIFDRIVDSVAWQQ